jgi:simple sugar transport system substrate-binding protein
MGVDVSVRGPSQFDLATVAHLIDEAVLEQPDGIALTVTDPDLFREPILRALSAGIPVVAYNTGAGPTLDDMDYLTFIGQDDDTAGYLSGIRLADSGATKGICVNHQVGNAGLDARCEGFLSAFEVYGLPADTLALSGDAAASQQTLADYLSANPDVDPSGVRTGAILTLGPTGAHALYAAMDQQGLAPGDLLHGTFDVSDQIVERIKDGTTLFAVDQQPFFQGYAAVSTLALLNRYGILPALSFTDTGPAFVDANNVEFQPDPQRPVDIRLVQHGLCDWDSFWCVVENGINQAAAEMQVNATVMGPEVFDVERVAQLVSEAVAQNPDGLAFTVTDAVLLRDPIQQALDGDIPVVAYNTGRGPLSDGMAYMTFLGQEEYRAGFEGGTRLAEDARGYSQDGGTRGVCVNHQAGNPSLDARCEGFLKAMEDQGIPAQMLAISTDPAAAEDILAGYFDANPDTDIVLTLGPVGAGIFYSFAATTGLDSVKHGTFDLSEAVITAIRDGTTRFTIDQQPFLQGYIAVQTLMLKARYGITPVIPVTPTGPSFVDAENVAIVEALAGQYR